MSRANPNYASQESPQTLRDGLAEYYACQAELFLPDEMPADEAALFRQHDAAHVVFGCDATIRGETLIDTWAIFGSTLGLRGYLEYLRLPQVNFIFSQTGYLRIAVELLRCLPDVVRIVGRSIRLSKKWPWHDYEKHLDRSLRDIRCQFNIHVV